eukprot:Protomagalhaensia_wolfi_Nauph_80__5378@NODE_585_length_2248_cov_294_478950_g438_i0_p2_GENE_NODE_585_length_2248_cov_294_478950_g438_i0NODE_585_length_2248_cov_294_478950_g438_i0_p2_ORF_typecomplete_len148_score40_17Voldacs/PF03517_13/9_2e05CDPS/PF16715_5/0_061_NODE_585_length_2248_cov_294_478950_g438_i011051548
MSSLELKAAHVKLESKTFKDCTVTITDNHWRVQTAEDPNHAIELVINKLQTVGRAQENELATVYCQLDDADGIIGIEEPPARLEEDEFDGFVEATFAFGKASDADDLFKALTDLLKETEPPVSESGEGEEESDDDEDAEVDVAESAS